MTVNVENHEHKEGWKHEYLDGGNLMVFERPAEQGGGFVTVDFKQRIFATGHGKPRQPAHTTTYAGRDWRNRIIRDAIDHLERVMTGTNSA